MSRIGVTRIDFPISALAVVIAVFDGAIFPVAASPTALAALFAVPLRKCIRAKSALPGGRWKVTVRHPWPAVTGLVVEGTGETIERAYADFGKGRVGLPRQVLDALLAAKVEGVTAETVTVGVPDAAPAVARWDGALSALCDLLVAVPRVGALV